MGNNSENSQNGVGMKNKSCDYDFSGKRVLLCEDHPLNSEIAVRLLNRKHCEVDTAENGAIGIELFVNSDIGYYDLILMDVRMPLMDGIDATKVIRNSNRADSDIPIIAMTANAFDDDVDSLLKSGMNRCLAKPFEPKELFKAIFEMTAIKFFLQEDCYEQSY